MLSESQWIQTFIHITYTGLALLFCLLKSTFNWILCRDICMTHWESSPNIWKQKNLATDSTPYNPINTSHTKYRVRTYVHVCMPIRSSFVVYVLYTCAVVNVHCSEYTTHVQCTMYIICAHTIYTEWNRVSIQPHNEICQSCAHKERME